MSAFSVLDDRIHILGRYAIESDSSSSFDNVASGIEFEFVGTSFSLVCKSLPKPRINKNYPMFTILSVMIDNQNPCEMMVEVHNEEFSEIKIAEGLSDSKHHVIIMKTDDPLISTFVLSKVIADDLVSFQSSKKKLLVYGDSITAGGDNTVIAGPSLDVVPGMGIGTYTYATLFSFMADMEISVFAQCGMPLANFTECENAINMLDIYTHISPQNTDEWEMKRFIPDLIMINLGTNDELGKFFDFDSFVEKYKTFIKSLDHLYPNNKFLLVCGQMNKSDRLVSSIFKVANDLREEGIETFAYEAKKARRGHPNVFEHKELAEELYQFVKKTKLI